MCIKCVYLITAECDENDVRLAAGGTPNDGRVEICLNGEWGSVCHHKWDVRDAEVVCRQLQHDGRKSQSSSIIFTQCLLSPSIISPAGSL